MPTIRRLLRLLALSLSLSLSLWCGAAGAQPLTVSAAASLTDAFKALGRRFEAQHPGVQLRLNFAASGVLLQQIRQGAPVDVFASADEDTMARAVQQQLVEPGTRVDFAGNQLVLVEPAQGGPGLRSLADLAAPAVRRIAIGKPATVPAGRYAREALQAAQLWTPLAPRLVDADSVRQVLDYVARGEVDAGFVYRSDTGAMAERLRLVLTLPTPAPLRYPAAVVRDSRQPALARAFLDYLMSPPARELLAQHGFEPP